MRATRRLWRKGRYVTPLLGQRECPALNLTKLYLAKVMNMLLGVLVEAVKTVSTIEREQLDADFARKAPWSNSGDSGKHLQVMCGSRCGTGTVPVHFSYVLDASFDFNPPDTLQ